MKIVRLDDRQKPPRGLPSVRVIKRRGKFIPVISHNQKLDTIGAPFPTAVLAEAEGLGILQSEGAALVYVWAYER